MPFLGSRSTQDWMKYDPDTATWVSGTGTLRPMNWREMYLYMYPNGDAPLTAMMSMMKSEAVDDPRFHWWTKSLPTQAGPITNIYVDPAMTTPYLGGGVFETPLYVNVDQETAAHFRAGHQCLLRSTTDVLVDVNAKVTSVVVSGANSVIGVLLLEADDNGVTGDLSGADRILINGNVNPEGGAMPAALAYDPTEFWNYTQIFRTPLELTRTALETRMRGPQAYAEAKREALEMHSIEQEKNYLWSVRSRRFGTNGNPERTTGGLVPFIRSYSNNISDFTTDTAVGLPAGAWEDLGGEWLDWWLAQVFRYGKDTRVGFVGYLTLLAINQLVKNSPTTRFEMTTKTKAFGFNVHEWVTPFGSVDLITHPLLSYEPTNARTMIVFDPTDLRYRYIHDTDFFAEQTKQNTGHGRIDGKKEEYLTEAGLEFHFPQKCAMLINFGQDRP